jgi:hypothetical protein
VIENFGYLAPSKAGMAELVDAPDLGSGVLGRAGSIPVPGTFAKLAAHLMG